MEAGSPLSSAREGGSEPLLPPGSSCALAGPLSASHPLPLALRPALSFCFRVPPTPCTPGSDSGPLSACATCHFPLLPSRLVSGASGSLSRVSAGLNLFFCLEAVLSRLSLCPVSLSLWFSVSLLLSLPLPPHILSCLWGTGNLGDQRDTRRLSCCRLEIKCVWGARAGWGMGDGGAQNPPRLPPGPAAETDRNYITTSGLSPTLWGLGLITRSPFGVPVRIQPSLLAGAGAWGWGAGNGASEGEREGSGWGEAGWVW